MRTAPSRSGDGEQIRTLDYDGELVGELYAFYDLEDKDFADGKRTAYHCAFRVRAESKDMVSAAYFRLCHKGPRYTLLPLL